MKSRKIKHDSLLERIIEVRKEIRKQVIEEVSREQEKMALEGRYPYEGLWLQLPEIKSIQKALKRRNISTLIELLFLFIFMLAFSYGIYRLMIWLLLPR